MQSGRDLPIWVPLVLALASQPVRGEDWRAHFAAMKPVDAHAHVFQSAPPFLAMLDQLDLRLLSVCVVDAYEPGYEELEPQLRMARGVFEATRGRAAWCSTFDPRAFEQEGFTQNVLTLLADTFQNGAVAVKIYKDIGMELKRTSGEYLMPDDPVFTPIFDFVASRNRTLFAHLAEPSAAWQPLDPESPHFSYYKNFPAWHMYQHPERPSKEAILAARDRLLQRHPKLRVVGCHLGSMEDDVADIASRLDRYPNFAVDTAARVNDLMLQESGRVREFLVKYQDRILYGTDRSFMPSDDPAETVARWEEEYGRDWKYFATTEILVVKGKTVRGLGLPEPVLRKLFHENAVRWVPGIAGR